MIMRLVPIACAAAMMLQLGATDPQLPKEMRDVMEKRARAQQFHVNKLREIVDDRNARPEPLLAAWDIEAIHDKDGKLVGSRCRLRLALWQDGLVVRNRALPGSNADDITVATMEGDRLAHFQRTLERDDIKPVRAGEILGFRAGTGSRIMRVFGSGSAPLWRSVGVPLPMESMSSIEGVTDETLQTAKLAGALVLIVNSCYANSQSVPFTELQRAQVRGLDPTKPESCNWLK